MDLKQVLKKAKKHSWWSEEAPGVPMFCIWMRAFVEQSKFWHPHLPNIGLMFYKNDFIYEETPEDQKLETWNYIFKKYLKNPYWQKQQYKTWKTFIGGFKKEGKRFVNDGKKMANSQLMESFLKFVEFVQNHWRMTWVMEAADIFTAYELPRILRKEMPLVSDKQIIDVALTLCAPTKLSFMEEERRDFLRIILSISSSDIRFLSHHTRSGDIRKNVAKKLEKHVQKYIWLLSNYKEGKPLTINYLLKQIKDYCRAKSKEELQKERRAIETKIARLKIEKRKIYSSLKFSKGLRAIFELLEFWSGWTDERKQNALVANMYLEVYAREFSKRLKRDVWEIKYMQPEELKKVLISRQNMPKEELSARRKFSVFVESKHAGQRREDIFVGKDAHKVWEAVFGAQKVKEIKGQVACAPALSDGVPVEKIQGQVQVIFDTSKQKFKTGNILVTTMTRPEFMPLLRKAKAIVTDEGGLTCHAAVISREFNLPCIIGTKIATKVLKDGDIVEINTASGVVKLIKRK